jgi:hypothetical protein
MKASIRALRDININEEITLAYTPLPFYPTSIRCPALQDRHNFDCMCLFCDGKIALTTNNMLLKCSYIDKNSGKSDKNRRNASAIRDGISNYIIDMHEKLNSLEFAINEYSQLLTSHTNDSVISEKCDMIDSLVRYLHVGLYKHAEYKCGKLFYVRLNYLVQLAEWSLARGISLNVYLYTSIWIKTIENSPKDIQLLCDAHVMCRMLTLKAEAMLIALKSGLDLFKDRFQLQTLNAFNDAISQATIIYGTNYALVSKLKSQRDEVLALGTSDESKMSASSAVDNVTKDCIDTQFEWFGPIACEIDQIKNIIARPVLRFIGFALRVDYDDANTYYAANMLINDIQSLENCRDIIFDGDNFESDSFTKLLPEIYNKIPNFQIWSVVRSEKDKERFSNSWKHSNIPKINVIFLNNKNSEDVSYSDFAIQCHFSQNPATLLCFGGGQCILDEYLAITTTVLDRTCCDIFFYDIERLALTKKGNNLDGKKKANSNNIPVPVTERSPLYDYPLVARNDAFVHFSCNHS